MSRNGLEHPQLGIPTAVYEYRRASGDTAFVVCRFEPKDFRPAHPTSAGRYAWNLEGAPTLLYRLPDVERALRDGEPIWIADGEKDVDALTAHGVTATCCARAQGWTLELAEQLIGVHQVWIVADNDDGPGLRQALQVRDLLLATTGIASEEITIVRAAAGKDAYDHFVAGHSLIDFVVVDPDTPTEEERVLIPFHELRARHEQEDTTDWIWDQLVAPGYLTRVDGRPKVAGKSTLLFALAAAIRNGQSFLGLDTRPATVAYCSEQRWQALHHKLILPYGAPPYMHLYYDKPLNLEQLVDRLLEETEQLGVELVIIDTAGKWMRLTQGGRFDPDVMATQMTLLEQLSQRVAVIVSDYTKKGEAAQGEGTLGATEQTGRADILIELKRPDPDYPAVRRLEITGRSDAPELIEYMRDETGLLVPCDLSEERTHASRGEVLEALADVEREGGPAPSGSALAKRLERRKGDVLDALNMLKEEGRVYTLGTGPRQVWALTAIGSDPPEPIAEEEVNGLF